MTPFSHRFRVRYAELDPQSVVFNSRYLEYADLLVSEFFIDRRKSGMPQDVEFHVRHAEIDFLKPIRAEEEIEGRLTVTKMGNTSMTMVVELSNADDPGDERARITLTQVHVDLDSGTPQRIPDSLRDAFGFLPVTTHD